MIKNTYVVEVSNIEIDNYYFSFDYTITKNGILLRTNSYDSDHAWYNDLDNFRKLLEEGYADKLALEHV